MVQSDFFFTYDKPRYDIVRQRVGETNWRHIEFYSPKTDEHDLPVYADDKKFLDKAREFFDDNDYKAPVIYLRTHFEKVCKDFCGKKSLKAKYKHNPKKVQGNDFWEAVKAYETSGNSFLDAKVASRVEPCRSLTPSHCGTEQLCSRELGESAHQGYTLLPSALFKDSSLKLWMRFHIK